MNGDPDGASDDASLFDLQLLTILLVTAVGLVGSGTVAAVLPSIGESLSVSDARVGLVMTAFFVPAAIAIPVVGSLADIYGRRPLVIGSLLLLGTAGVATAVVDDFAALLVLRALQGVGFAGTTPLSIVLVGDHYAGTEGSTVQGLRLSANGVSGLALPAAAGALAGIAWNFPFLLFALAFPVALLTHRYLPPVPRTGMDEGGVGETFREYARAMRAEAADRSLLVLVIGAFVLFFVRYGLVTFMPLFAVRRLDASAFEAGLLVSLLGFFRMVIAPASGLVVARFARKYVLVATVLLAGVGVGLVPFAPGVLALVAPLAVYGVGAVTFVPVLNDTVANMASAENRAGVVSAMNVFKNVAMAAAPAAFGVVLAASGFEIVFLAAGAIGVVFAAVAFLLVDPVHIALGHETGAGAD